MIKLILTTATFLAAAGLAQAGPFGFDLQPGLDGGWAMHPAELGCALIEDGPYDCSAVVPQPVRGIAIYEVWFTEQHGYCMIIGRGDPAQDATATFTTLAGLLAQKYGPATASTANDVRRHWMLDDAAFETILLQRDGKDLSLLYNINPCATPAAPDDTIERL